jgi:hypothetical protein
VRSTAVRVATQRYSLFHIPLFAFSSHRRRRSAILLIRAPTRLLQAKPKEAPLDNNGNQVDQHKQTNVSHSRLQHANFKRIYQRAQIGRLINSPQI